MILKLLLLILVITARLTAFSILFLLRLVLWAFVLIICFIGVTVCPCILCLVGLGTGGPVEGGPFAIVQATLQGGIQADSIMAQAQSVAMGG
jgi:hypothetical protein